MARKQAGCLNMTLGCLGFVFLGGLMLAGSIGFVSQSNQKSQQQLNQTLPLGTFERLKHDLKHEGNLSQTGSTLVLTFTAGEFMTTSSIQHTVTNSLRTIKASGYDYTGARFSATATLADKFGNQRTAEIASLQYERDTVDRINFKNFVAWDVFDIADYKRLHPVIQAD